MLRLFLLCCFLLLAILAGSGCRPQDAGIIVEMELPDYVAAKQKIREGEHEAALRLLHRVIDQHAHTPESHLEAGLIYLHQEDDPVVATYHFRRYLEQKPHSREAPLVEELIMSARKQFAASLPGNPFKEAVSRMELLESIADLKRRVESLSEENQRLLEANRQLGIKADGNQRALEGIFEQASPRQPSAIDRTDGVVAQALTLPPSAQQPTLAPSAPQPTVRQIPSTHEVRPGDSLYGISMRYYGSADQIQAIFQANREILRSVNDLRPGQLLKLPR